MSSRRDGESLEEVLEDHDDDGDEESSRTVFLVGGVEEIRIKKAVRKILALVEAGSTTDPIYLYLSTFGGSIEEAFALYDVIKYVPCPVHTIGVGKIMSAGCLILAGGEAGERSMSANSALMYHAGWDQFVGNAWEVQASLDYFKGQERRYDELVAAECGRTVQEVEDLYAVKRVDKYLTAQQALDFGFVDKILPASAPRKKKGSR